ncbi:hypothetical protein PR048_024024 [Dryococelus australis]|uniref:Uncharacterized protein n=1 Tax=Dryococelus australis TaxID=614101 RepID=A0ABQ9GVQ5_9NEOP|nr:hypothetical protein PR048_024024 [Dryococelus australis]
MGSLSSGLSGPAIWFDAAPPSPSAQRHPPLINSHHRSFSETLQQPNGGGDHTDRVPSSYPYPRLGSGDPGVDSMQQGFWRTTPQSDEGERDAYRVVG